MLRRFFTCTVLAGMAASAVWSADPVAVILAPLQGESRVSRSLTGTLVRAGYDTRITTFDTLTPDTLASADLLAIPDARTLPHSLHDPLEQFVRRGGDLLVFGLPAWEKPLLKAQGSWVDANEYARSEAWTPPAHPITGVFGVQPPEWTRSTNHPASSTKHQVVKTSNGPALHVQIPELTSWDTLLTPPLDHPFPSGTDRFVFAARGGPRTKALAVEWMERDGSRWIGTVPLTTTWKRYELSPESFKFWPSTPGRGGPGDRFHPENASRLSVGLAFSHTGQTGGRHEYWFANPGASSAEDAPLSALDSREWLDGLYPAFKTFAIRDKVSLTSTRAPLFPVKDLPRVRGMLRSPHPRPTGTGFNKERERRFVPLLEARSPKGDWRGTPGVLFIHPSGRYKDSHWAVFGITDQVFLGSPEFQSSVETLARRLRGPLLAEGGTEWYTTLPDTTTRMGASVTGPLTPTTSVELVVTDAKSGTTRIRHLWPASAPETPTLPVPARGETLRVEVSLREGPVLLDRLSHELHTWQPPEHPRFVTVRGGQFHRDGKPWKVHGVNYMPSSGIGLDHPEGWAHFEYWLDSAPYDPEIIGRDLETIQRLGLNSVSAFVYNRSLESGNLLDFLRQCTERGLLVNLSLRPGTPMDFQWDLIRPIIERYRLAENDTIFAYDLAWEPNWGNQKDRSAYDKLWNEWIVQRYGSVEAAEQAWGFPVPRAEGGLTNPTDEQVTSDGPWRRMSADYRAFLNGLLHERYGRARELVRGIDPNHLVSFRMSEAGNPTFEYPAFLPYDLAGVARAVDFLAPEAYGRIGDWLNVRHGWFEAAYARAVAPALPVIWAEVGVSAWESGTDEATRDRLDFQARYLRDFYRMMRLSGSNGIYFWWYPGGYRSNENSDYGIINPDGTDRPATRIIRDNGPAFLNAPAPVPVDAWLNIAPSRYANGVVGAYKDVQNDWWTLVEEGKSPGLRLNP